MRLLAWLHKISLLLVLVRLLVGQAEIMFMTNFRLYKLILNKKEIDLFYNRFVLTIIFFCHLHYFISSENLGKNLKKNLQHSFFFTTFQSKLNWRIWQNKYTHGCLITSKGIQKLTLPTICLKTAHMRGLIGVQNQNSHLFIYFCVNTFLFVNQICVLFGCQELFFSFGHQSTTNRKIMDF